MSMTSCISHPDRERLVIIRKWQVEFCDGNQCAAALLSFFEYWHSWKLDTDHYNRKSNDISELHGETRLLSEDVFQFHSLGELSEGILNLYGEKSISKALKLLEEKSVISIHANPNPRFHYDKRQYFRFYPAVCNQWIKTSYKSRSGKNAPSTTQNCRHDDAKIQDAQSNFSSLSGKNAVLKTEINNKEEINKSINARDELDEANSEEGSPVNAEAIVTLLKNLGMPRNYLASVDDLKLICNLLEQGATAQAFEQGYKQALQATTSKGKTFGMRYLAKVVEGFMEKQISKASYRDVATPKPTSQPPIERRKEMEFSYENDFTGGMSWMGDLV